MQLFDYHTRQKSQIKGFRQPSRKTLEIAKMVNGILKTFPNKFIAKKLITKHNVRSLHKMSHKKATGVFSSFIQEIRGITV